MRGMPKEVKNIYARYYNRSYVINEGEEDELDYYAEKEISSLKITNEIVEENEEFVNGFKVVKFANGQYGYIRESDNKLLPYRYDLAFDFNEYGYAMVGRNGTVTWINKDFYYYKRGGMTEDAIYKNHSDGTYFVGWMEGRSKIEEFSKGSIPLSRIWVDLDMCVYFGIDGKVLSFKRYGQDNNERCYENTFRYGSKFDGNGLASAKGTSLAKNSGVLLFAEGFYLDFDKLSSLAIKKGFIDSIRDELKEENSKTLKTVR